MSADAKSRYFRELSRNLQYEGFTVKPETEESLLPVELDGQHLCQVTEVGGVRYRKEDVAGDTRSEALDRVTDTARTTAEYMGQMETAPQLTASSLTGDYRLLAEFSDTVLAGHPSEYGVQFITWKWAQKRTALYQGDYYGPDTGVESYASAKRDFAARSGLVPRDSLFTPEQLTEIYLCVDLEMDGTARIRDERQEVLQGIKDQLERLIPDIAERAEQSFLKDPDMESRPLQEQFFNMQRTKSITFQEANSRKRTAPLFILPFSGTAHTKGAEDNGTIFHGRHPAGGAGADDDRRIQEAPRPDLPPGGYAPEETALWPACQAAAS